MVEEQLRKLYDNDKEAMKKMLLPSVTSKVGDYKINTYGNDDEYKIAGMEGEYVIVYFFNRSYSFVHKMYFKVVSENGQLYISPAPFDEGYFDPWEKIERNVNVDTYKLKPTFREEKLRR